MCVCVCINVHIYIYTGMQRNLNQQIPESREPRTFTKGKEGVHALKV